MNNGRAALPMDARRPRPPLAGTFRLRRGGYEERKFRFKVPASGDAPEIAAMLWAEYRSHREEGRCSPIPVWGARCERELVDILRADKFPNNWNQGIGVLISEGRDLLAANLVGYFDAIGARDAGDAHAIVSCNYQSIVLTCKQKGARGIGLNLAGNHILALQISSVRPPGVERKIYTEAKLWRGAVSDRHRHALVEAIRSEGPEDHYKIAFDSALVNQNRFQDMGFRAIRHFSVDDAELDYTTFVIDAEILARNTAAVLSIAADRIGQTK